MEGFAGVSLQQPSSSGKGGTGGVEPEARIVSILNGDIPFLDPIM